MASPSEKAVSEKIKFHYIKAEGFRVFSPDGASGGITPSGQIQMNFFATRLPIAEMESHEIKADGSISPQPNKEDRICKDGFVRDVEVTALLDLGVAQNIYKWLELQIGQLKKAMDEFEARQKK